MEMLFQRGSSRRAEGEDVGDEPHRGLRAVDVGAAGDVLLEDVVLDGATQSLARDAPAIGHGHVERQEDRRGGIDGHGGGDPVQGQVRQQDLHVVERRDGHAHAADLAGSHRRVGVVAHLRGQVEGHRQAGLALLQQVPEALVRLGCAREAGVLAHRPEAPAVHRRLDAPREGELTWATEGQLLVQGIRVCRGVEVRDLEVRRRHEAGPPFGMPLERTSPRRLAPAVAAWIVARHTPDGSTAGAPASAGAGSCLCTKTRPRDGHRQLPAAAGAPAVIHRFGGRRHPHCG